jgi:hypothetical protein
MGLGERRRQVRLGLWVRSSRGWRSLGVCSGRWRPRPAVRPRPKVGRARSRPFVMLGSGGALASATVSESMASRLPPPRRSAESRSTRWDRIPGRFAPALGHPVMLGLVRHRLLAPSSVRMISCYLRTPPADSRAGPLLPRRGAGVVEASILDSELGSLWRLRERTRDMRRCRMPCSSRLPDSPRRLAIRFRRTARPR